MASGKVLIALDHVGLKYSRKSLFGGSREYWALKDISFNLYEGECLGIIGRNGVGKSSLLKVLSDILQPDRGVVTRKQGLRSSLLTLQLGFSSKLSGRDNAILSGMLLGMSQQKIESRLDEIIAFAELEDFIDEALSTYSSGMKARLGFSVAMQAHPDVLLIDEVLGVGDADFKQRSQAVIKDWISSEKTVVFVSHAVDTISTLCDRAVWIENGRVAMEGLTEDVLFQYERYNRLLKRLSSLTNKPEKEMRNSIKNDPLTFLDAMEQSYKESVAGENAQKSPKENSRK